MRDPDVCMIDMGPGPGLQRGLVPFSFRNDYRGIDNESVELNEEGGISGFRPRMQADIRAFSELWARNLADQQGLADEPVPEEAPAPVEGEAVQATA